MLSCYLLKPASLDDVSLKHLKEITSTDYHCCFEGKSPDSEDLAEGRVYVAEIEGQTAAVALVSVLKSPKLAEIHEIAIFPDFSALKPCKQLLKYIETVLKDEYCMVLCFFYEKIAGSIATDEELFAESDWENPRLHMIRYHFDCYAFSPPWFLKDYTIPEGVSIFPWKELTADEYSLIEHAQKRHKFPYIVSPLYDEKYIQHINSLGMRKDGQLIGWMVTHTFPSKPDTVRYTSFYLSDDYRFTGLSAILLQKSIMLQQSSDLQWSYFLLNIQYSDANWITFINRRLKSQAKPIIEVWRRCKTLHTPTIPQM